MRGATNCGRIWWLYDQKRPRFGSRALGAGQPAPVSVPRTPATLTAHRQPGAASLIDDRLSRRCAAAGDGEDPEGPGRGRGGTAVERPADVPGAVGHGED